MSVSPEEVRFKGGYMDGLFLRIQNWRYSDLWEANHNTQMAEFSAGDFWYASVIRGVQAFHAKCEKF